MLASTVKFCDLTQSNCFRKQKFSDFNIYRKNILKEEDFDELICEKSLFANFAKPIRFKMLAIELQKEDFYKRLFRMLDLEDNWDGENGLAIKQANFQNLYCFAQYLFNNYCDFSLMASPTKDGSITCDLYDDRCEMLITFNELFISVYYNKNDVDTYKKINLNKDDSFKLALESMKDIIYEFSK